MIEAFIRRHLTGVITILAGTLAAILLAVLVSGKADREKSCVETKRCRNSEIKPTYQQIGRYSFECLCVEQPLDR